MGVGTASNVLLSVLFLEGGKRELIWEVAENKRLYYRMLRLTIQYKKLQNFRVEVACATCMSRYIMIHSHITGFPPLLSLMQCTGYAAVS